MTTKKTLILALTLLTAGALATSCSNEDNISDGPQAQQPANGTITLTATLAPKGGASRDQSGTRSVDADGKTAWVSGEKVAVYYQKTDDTYATATATVGEPNADGSAPITASLDDAKDGGMAKFVYPATLSDGAGGIDASILGGQDGTMAGISANFDAATGEGTITVSGTFGTTGIYVAMLPVSDKKVSIWAYTASTTYIFKKSVTLAAGNLYKSLAIPCYPETVNLSSVTTTSGGVEMVGSTPGTPTLRLRDGQLVTGSLVRNGDADTDHRVKVTIADGATVTLSGATIDGKTTNDTSAPWAGITCEGDATILLTGANTVTNFHSDYPAIFVPEGKTLTIGGSGSLTASNTCYDDTGSGAAIGGGYDMACGNIAITGGTVTANGGSSSAAIGGGNGASCGSITISGGTVTATATAAGNSGAGIGSGRFGGSGASCGDITISGTARVTATGGGNGAGIGSAGANEYNANTCGNISISGACTVIATGGDNAAGIGTGWHATCGSISITGGTVRAQGGNYAAGIGCGLGSNKSKSECGDITIKTIVGHKDDFTSVTAIMGQGAKRPIGHSSRYSDRNTCGTITFGVFPVYNAGDDPGNYNIVADGLKFEETTTDLGDPNEDYTDNTWVLRL